MRGNNINDIFVMGGENAKGCLVTTWLHFYTCLILVMSVRLQQSNIRRKTGVTNKVLVAHKWKIKLQLICYVLRRKGVPVTQKIFMVSFDCHFFLYLLYISKTVIWYFTILRIHTQIHSWLTSAKVGLASRLSGALNKLATFPTSAQIEVVLLNIAFCD